MASQSQLKGLYKQVKALQKAANKLAVSKGYSVSKNTNGVGYSVSKGGVSSSSLGPKTASSSGGSKTAVSTAYVAPKAPSTAITSSAYGYTPAPAAKPASTFLQSKEKEKNPYAGFGMSTPQGPVSFGPITPKTPPKNLANLVGSTPLMSTANSTPATTSQQSSGFMDFVKKLGSSLSGALSGKNQSATAINAVSQFGQQKSPQTTSYNIPKVSTDFAKNQFMTPDPNYLAATNKNPFMSSANSAGMSTASGPVSFNLSNQLNAIKRSSGSSATPVTRPTTVTDRPTQTPEDSGVNVVQYGDMPATERTAYNFFGQGNVPSNNLSEAQASTVAKMQEVATQKAMAADAAASATTPEEQAQAEEEYAALDLEEKELERERRKLDKEYERLSSQTDEDLASYKALQNLETGLMQGVENVGREPIPLAAIGGYQRQLERDADLKRIPLQQQLAREQAQRKSMLSVLESRMGNLDRRADKLSNRRSQYQQSLKDIQKEKKDKEKERLALMREGFSVGDTRYQFNPDTGRYEVFATAPSKPPKASTFKSGYAEFTDQDMGDIQSALNDVGSDGYSNTGTYTDALNLWKKNGGVISDFKKQFPHEDYLNPNDPTAKKYFDKNDNPFS